MWGELVTNKKIKHINNAIINNNTSFSFGYPHLTLLLPLSHCAMCIIDLVNKCFPQEKLTNVYLHQDATAASASSSLTCILEDRPSEVTTLVRRMIMIKA